jgi:glycosyltransferase involved in cell wall biosynthesis
MNTGDSPILRNLDIIVLSDNEWEDNRGTNHEIVWRLSDTNRILFIELPISPLSPFTGLRRGIWKKHIKWWFKGIRQGDKPNLFIACPPPVLPFRFHRWTNVFNQALQTFFVRQMLKRLHFKNDIIVTFRADSGFFVRKMHAKVKVYYCTDDWSAFHFWWQPGRLVATREQELIHSCDLIFGTSQILTDRFKQQGKTAYFLPNRVDFSLFSQAQHLNPPDDESHIKKPVIGFVGTIYRDNFDAGLVFRMAQRHPEWSFLIVCRPLGREPDLTPLKRLHNVHFVDFRPQHELPRYLSAMDVCLIPRTPTTLSQTAFPLKLFEYLAAGKPVVATRTEELLPFSDYVYLAGTNEEFEDCVARALRENNPDQTAKRMALARDNDWHRNIIDFSSAVKEFLASR